MTTVIATTEEALQQEAVSLAARLTPHAEHATLITLSGDLGAGKTTFTQALARALGVEEPITSPTFVLAKAYTLPEGGEFERLVHIDAYRLSGGENDMRAIGLTETYADPRALVVLEWPEMLGDALPRADHAITITVADEGTARTIAYA